MSGVDEQSAPADAPAPTLGELFRGFSQIGLSGFGGVLPFARHFLVERRGWLSGDEFNSLLGLCQFLPGPNVVNLSVCVGARYRGAAGALAATLGLIGGPFLIVIALAIAYDAWRDVPAVQGVLRGIAAAGVGLLVATFVRMAKNVAAPFLPFALIVVLAIAVLRWPLVPVLVGLLVLAATLARLRMRKARDGDGA